MNVSSANPNFQDVRQRSHRERQNSHSLSQPELSSIVSNQTSFNRGIVESWSRGIVARSKEGTPTFPAAASRGTKATADLELIPASCGGRARRGIRTVASAAFKVSAEDDAAEDGSDFDLKVGSRCFGGVTWTERTSGYARVKLNRLKIRSRALDSWIDRTGIENAVIIELNARIDS